ncbi:MAG: hypothetical protein LBK60_10950 [Verrucomicrobiales bacterium]|jgi:outer membrane protein assembly factor BamD (BamD/ComL family)|nr:hypothetical protein [Verrucomicrobiales bacterium]
MAEQDNNSFNDQPVLVEDNSLAKIAWQLIIGAAVAVAVVGAAVYYWYQKQQTAEIAAAALAAAHDAAQWQQVVDQYPGTAAAGSALLLLAADRQEKQDYAGAAELYAGYLQKYADSSLVSAVQFARAQSLAADGQTDAAQTAYLAIVDAKPANPYAGGAAVALARVYLAGHNVSAARQTLTDFISREVNVNSSFLNEANQLLRELPQGGAGR